MTYNECVKKLADFARCKYLGEVCDDCFFGEEKDECIIYLCHCAHTLIKRQQAEIERLNKEVDRLSQLFLYHDGDVADAVKDFSALLVSRAKSAKERFLLKSLVESVMKEVSG